MGRPSAHLTSDHTSSEVLGSLKNSTQAGTKKATTQALTVILQVGFVNIVWHFRLHDIQLQRQGRRGLPPGQHILQWQPLQEVSGPDHRDDGFLLKSCRRAWQPGQPQLEVAQGAFPSWHTHLSG